MDQYELERERLKRRRAVSDALLAQSMQPMGGTEVVSGVAVRRSPFEGLAKVGQAYFAKQRSDQIDAEEKGLGERQRQDLADAMSEYQRNVGPREVQSYEGMTGGLDEGLPDATTFVDRTPEDRRAAAMTLMGKVGDPRDAAKMLVADALKVPEVKAYKRGDVLYQGGSKVGEIAREPNWQRTELPTPAGGKRVGVMDMNATDPITTFREGGAENPAVQLAPSGVAFNPKETQPGTAFADPNKPFFPGDAGPVPNKPLQDYEARKAAAGAARVTANATVKEGQRVFENEDKLRADYKAEPLVKAASEMSSAFQTIDAAFKRPSAANDLAMATKYMKILDPTSVVRESEFALAVNATGLLDKVGNYAAAILKGEKLNPAQRKDFYDSAKAIHDAFQEKRAEVDQQYSEMATGYNLKPENVIPSLRTPKAAGRPGLPTVDAIEAELKRRKVK